MQKFSSLPFGVERLAYITLNAKRST